MSTTNVVTLMPLSLLIIGRMAGTIIIIMVGSMIMKMGPFCGPLFSKWTLPPSPGKFLAFSPLSPGGAVKGRGERKTMGVGVGG